MKKVVFVFISMLFLLACNNRNGIFAIPGQMPNLTIDQSATVHLVYGRGDSILYCSFNNNKNSFSYPALVAVLPQLAASHTRGPQIAATSSMLVVTACNNAGDIFAFTKQESGSWSKAVKINDADTMAKENLMALSADQKNVFAVWPDLRDGRNRIYGTRSSDGGKSWSPNKLVYTSPDSTVCECCKPSVVVKGNTIYVMFRNWLNGNRDMYLIQSSDGGESFGQAQKLGNGSWALNACPMDGGALVVNENGNVETVWRREGIIYASVPGKEEKKIGEGKNCTMETVNGKNVYAWVENGDVVVVKPRGKKKNLGKGQSPVLKAINNEHVVCVWENDKKIHETVIEL
jgi:hypothetical protein